jgi:hypothetical protein
MSTLLVQGCSKSKNRTAEPVPALELYSGFFFKIIKKSIRGGEMNDDIDICILSAEHGLVDVETPIETYDRRMDRQRARELAPEVSNDLDRWVDGQYDRVVLNLGRTYRRTLDEFTPNSEVSLCHIDGEGIGEKGHALKRFLRGDDSVVEEYQPPLETGQQ